MIFPSSSYSHSRLKISTNQSTGQVWTNKDNQGFIVAPYPTSKMRAKGNNRGSSSSTQLSASLWVQEKGSRNKRKFLSDPPLGDPNKLPTCSQNEGWSYEFSAEGYESSLNPEQYCLCQMCRISQDLPDAFQLELKVSGAAKSKSSIVEPAQPFGAPLPDPQDFQDADWSDLTESQLEELCLNNLDLIFKSAIKKIAAYGYSEDGVAKAVLRADLCYGCKDTVSNIVDNTLAFLQSGQEIDTGRDHFFENLEQLEKYILAEMVCVLREVRPFFSTGDAMWCLLICDMNVSHACAAEGDPLNGLGSDEASGSSTLSDAPQLKPKADSSGERVPNSSKPNPLSASPDTSLPKPPIAKGKNLPNPCNPAVNEGVSPNKESPITSSSIMEKSLGAIQEFIQVKSQPSSSVEKSGAARKGHIGRREYILRQKSFHFEKTYRGAMKTGKLSSLGGLILDKKPKSGIGSTSNPKNASSKVKKAVGINVTQADGSQNPVVNAGLTNHATSNQKTVKTPSALPKGNTDPSLTEPSKSSAPIDRPKSTTEVHSFDYYGIPFDKTTGRWVPRDKQDEMIMKLVSRAEELQNELQEWTGWANHKVMQATRRLGKDKGELKTLRQEKEEAERFQKERQTLEENTVKKLSEMENALSKATAQVERANAAVQRLELENSKLRQDMAEAKIRAAESAASCEEVSEREKRMMKESQSWETQKALLQEELAMLRRRRVQLELEVQKARDYLNQLEVRRKQEQKAKEEFLVQAESMRMAKEQSEAAAKLEEETIISKAENDLKKYKDDIRNLEIQISHLRLKTDPSNTVRLQWGADGRSGPGNKGTQLNPCASDTKVQGQDNLGNKNVKRERECVMCLAEERSVVFLPCAHQVVCPKCNELHEKHGMKECPSCRTLIQRRICARFARP